MRNSKTTVLALPDTIYYGQFEKLHRVVLADSAETKLNYLGEYITYLKKEMNKLTLLDHALEIAGICNEIKKAKRLMTGM
jgi:hypothetical protein